MDKRTRAYQLFRDGCAAYEKADGLYGGNVAAVFHPEVQLLAAIATMIDAATTKKKAKAKPLAFTSGQFVDHVKLHAPGAFDFSYPNSTLWSQINRGIRDLGLTADFPGEFCLWLNEGRPHTAGWNKLSCDLLGQNFRRWAIEVLNPDDYISPKEGPQNELNFV